MENTIKGVIRLGFGKTSRRQEAMRNLKSLDRTRNNNRLTETNPDTTYIVDHYPMCHLATNCSSKSNIYKEVGRKARQKKMQQ